MLVVKPANRQGRVLEAMGEIEAWATRVVHKPSVRAPLRFGRFHLVEATMLSKRSDTFFELIKTEKMARSVTAIRVTLVSVMGPWMIWSIKRFVVGQLISDSKRAKAACARPREVVRCLSGVTLRHSNELSRPRGRGL